MPDPAELQPADVILTRSKTLLGSLIRFFTRRFGESRTKVNHAGVVVEGGAAQSAVVVEALAFVRRQRLWARYGNSRRYEVSVFRPRDISGEDVAKIVGSAEKDVGQKYGWLMVAAHLLDWTLLGAYVFRRLIRAEDYPICSWLVAWAYQKAGRNFGVPPAAASPDDIWDYVRGHPEAFEEVVALGPLAS